MSKIALSVELPVQLLHLSDYTDQDFIIASYMQEFPEYRDFYIARRRHKRVFTILDNGAFENGKSMGVKDYDNIVQDLQPHVVVLPDVVNDAVATINASKEFLNRTQTSPPCYMGVLQGKGLTDYYYCLESYLRLRDRVPLRVIGIPYHIFYRPTLLRKYDIHNICAQEEMQIHILGLPNPYELLPLKRFSQVSSVDSSLPISSAWHGMNIAKSEWIEGFRVPVDEDISENTKKLAEENIAALKIFCLRT